MLAASDDRKDLVEYLISKGSNVNWKDTGEGGTTALAMAKQNGHKEMVEILKKAGAKD